MYASRLALSPLPPSLSNQLNEAGGTDVVPSSLPLSLSLSLLIMQCCAVLSTFRNLDHHQSSGDRDEVIRKARVLDSRVGDISNLSRLFLIFEFFQRYICLDLMNSSQDSQQWHVSRPANAAFYLPDLPSRQRTSAFHVGWGQSSCRAEPC